MKSARVIRTGDEAGPGEPRSEAVDRILSQISQLYFERATVLRTGDQAAFQAVDAKIALLKKRLAKI